MKNLRYIFLVIVFLFFKTSFAFSELTASAPTNIIQSIASATSFSSINENTAESADQVQNATSEAINTEEVLETVQQEAETFGQQNDEEALAAFSGSGDTQLIVIGGEENQYAGKDDLEPNLDTIVYDTGMMTLTKEGGNYNNDNTNTIFDATPGAQQARIKVYVDFKRNVLFGEIESTVTLHNGSGMTTLAKGGSSDLGDANFPIDRELTKTLVTSTGKIGVGATDDPFPWFDESGSGTNGKHSITSFIREDGQPAEFWDNSERLAMQKNVSHAAGGTENVLIEARFKTATGLLGTSTASFEASHAAHNASAADFIDGVVRYSATVETIATNYTGD